MSSLSTLSCERSSRKSNADSLLEEARQINQIHNTRKDISGLEMNRLAAGTVAESRRLPTELLLLIFDYTSVEDVLRCRITCRRFRQIIDEEPEMQYKIELYVAGCIDNKANRHVVTTIRERLQILRAHQSRWKTPGDCYWERIDTDRLWWCGAVQVYDNLWTATYFDPALLHGEGFIAHATLKNAIRLTCFDQGTDGTPFVDSWTLTFPVPFEHIIADVPRETLYLLNPNITNEQGFQCYRVRTTSLTDDSLLSDQLLHTQIKLPEYQLAPTVLCIGIIASTLTLVCVTLPRLTDTGPQVTQMNVALLNIGSGDVQVIVTYIKRVPAFNDHLKVHLVNDTTLLLHIMEGGLFTTEVHILTRVPSSSWTLRHVATFEYPSVTPSYVKTMVSHYCTGTWNRTHGVFSRRAPPSPFIPSHDADLLMVCRFFKGTRILHYVPTSVFKTAQEKLGPLPSSAEVTIFPWESWGPENSRCFCDTITPGLRFPNTFGNFGYRILQRDMTFLDFNQLDLARDLQGIVASSTQCGEQGTKDGVTRFSPNALSKKVRSFWPPHFGRFGELSEGTNASQDDVRYEHTNTRIIRRPTVIPRGRIFDKDVITKLPYRQTQLEWNESISYPLSFFGGETWVAMTRDGSPLDFAYYALRKRQTE